MDNALTLGVVDTGAHQTVMDTKMAAALGLTITAAQHNDCGEYSVAGGPTFSYVGKVNGQVLLRFGEDVAYAIDGLRLIEHPHPLLLIGHDVLCGGRSQGEWSYAGEDRERIGGAV